jgi:hypothetical protein
LIVTGALFHQHELLESGLPYRLNSIQLGDLICRQSLSGIDLGNKFCEIRFDGQLKFEGRGTLVTNPLIESACVHSRAMLEFLGIKVTRYGLSELTGSRRADDIGIEHLRTSQGAFLARVTLAEVQSYWGGPWQAAHQAWSDALTATHKRLAHVTRALATADPEQLRILFSGVLALVESKVYTALGLPFPTLGTSRDATDAP